MAKGSPDYWVTQTNFLPNIISEIFDAVLAGNTYMAKLDSIDGKLDNQITLDGLNSSQCELLATLLGIPTAGFSDADLLAKLDALDGTMDGKLDLSQLNGSNVVSNLATCITHLSDIVSGISTGTNPKLDTAITNLASVITALTTGTNPKLDSAITNLASVITALTTGTNPKLDSAITNLASVITVLTTGTNPKLDSAITALSSGTNPKLDSCITQLQAAVTQLTNCYNQITALYEETVSNNDYTKYTNAYALDVNTYTLFFNIESNRVECGFKCTYDTHGDVLGLYTYNGFSYTLLKALSVGDDYKTSIQDAIYIKRSDPATGQTNFFYYDKKI
jgi:hypothetical protein